MSNDSQAFRPAAADDPFTINQRQASTIDLMNSPLTGIHHVTAIATNPHANIDFYTGLLGLRPVKKTVNFDDPSAYHLYYGDETGTPGTIVTFFYWPNGA